MEAVIETMFAVLEAGNTADTMYLMDGICSILFNSEMLLAESRNLKDNPKSRTPI